LSTVRIGSPTSSITGQQGITVPTRFSRAQPKAREITGAGQHHHRLDGRVPWYRAFAIGKHASVAEHQEPDVEPAYPTQELLLALNSPSLPKRNSTNP